MKNNLYIKKIQSLSLISVNCITNFNIWNGNKNISEKYWLKDSSP